MDKVIQSIKSLPLEKTWVSKDLHFNRNEFNMTPDGVLIGKDGANNVPNIFVDDQGQGWLKMPWYYTIFHNPLKNVKLLHLDSNFVGNALGSSEIIVPKKKIQKDNAKGTMYILNKDVKQGSYNYRDGYVSSQWKHFVADVFPNVIYWKR